MSRASFLRILRICESSGAERIVNARVSVSGGGFWENTISHFFDIRITYHRLKYTQQYELNKRINPPKNLTFASGVFILQDPYFFSFHKQETATLFKVAIYVRIKEPLKYLYQ